MTLLNYWKYSERKFKNGLIALRQLLEIEIMESTKRKPTCECGSDEFYIGFKTMICFICKQHYKKNQFCGTVIQCLSNQEYELDYKLEKAK